MMSMVAVIGLVAACTASPSLYFGGPQYYSGYYPAALVSPIKTQYHSQNEQGQYAYGYNDGYSSKSETKHANGLTEGAYSYVDPNGVLQQYRYVSDENGYRVSGTNLPAAPVPVAYAAAPAPVAYAAATVSEIPQPVQDTPEVAAAKVAHQVAYDQAKKAADEAPAAEEAPVDYAPTPVQDTPEVAAAKAAHLVAHEQAKQVNNAYAAFPSYAVAAPAASYAYSVAPAPAPAFVAVSSSSAEVPQQVQDTPEVAAAKAAHHAAFEQAKKAAEEAPSDEGSSSAQEQPASDAVSVTAAVTKTAAPAVAYSYQSAYPASYAVAAPAPVASYAYAAAPAYNYAVAAPAPVASYGYAAAAPTYAYAPFAAGSYSPVHSQYHSQDEFGQYSYGYNSGSSSKAEVKTLDGVTRGGYSYVDSNGIVQHYNYVSDAVNGFRVAGTNLPSNTL